MLEIKKKTYTNVVIISSVDKDFKPKLSLENLAYRQSSLLVQNEYYTSVVISKLSIKENFCSQKLVIV